MRMTCVAATLLYGAEVQKTFVAWRAHVGRGPLSPELARRLRRRAIVDARLTGARIIRAEIVGGAAGPAVYLDIASRNPVWTLRHARPLVLALGDPPYRGGWAIRLRDGHGDTVWIAGHAGSEGFVGSATRALGAASPVAHG